MKIKILSDLHLEFENLHLPSDDADIIILAGDVHTKGRGVAWARDEFKGKPVLYVLGNHEFYGKAHPKMVHEMKDEAKGSNVHILERDAIYIDGVHFLGCTLWTDFNLLGDGQAAGVVCMNLMSDFKKIRLHPSYSKFFPADWHAIHRLSLEWLEKSLSEIGGKPKVVISHHAPSVQSLLPGDRKSIISAAYASDLTDVIRKHAPDFWFHGHIHNNSDYTIGRSRVICNPRGYPGERNPGFDSSLTIEIGT